MSPSVDENPASAPARPLRILLVEDNADDALLLERHLRKYGFKPSLRRVETPSEMTEVLNGPELPEIILADYNLPEFSGMEALAMAQASGLDLPFIMLSGVMTETTAVESMRAGAHDYVTKQNLARLVPAVERELREAEDRRRKLAVEVALEQSQDRFHRLVEGMPMGLLIANSEGQIVYANDAAIGLFGIGNDGTSLLLGKLCPTLADVHHFLGGLLEAPRPFEATCHTLAGVPMEVLVGIAVLNPDAAPGERQLAAFLADLTLQKKGEEMLRRTEKLAVAGRLAASIAHEINNPLEAITNLLYLVGTTELDGSAREYLEAAQVELDRVARITVQTLRFHRRSTRAMLTDAEDLVASVMPLFESRLRQSDVQVARRFRPAPRVLVHDGEIRQVVANLIGNATDALGHGGRLLVRTTAARHPRTGTDGVAITVADTGSGISVDALPHIFEPFFSTKGNTGTGLGLWVSLEIVERHDGMIRVKSRKGMGTVFRMFLPVESTSIREAA